MRVADLAMTAGAVAPSWHDNDVVALLKFRRLGDKTEEQRQRTAREHEELEEAERQRREKYADELGLNPDTGEPFKQVKPVPILEEHKVLVGTSKNRGG